MRAVLFLFAILTAGPVLAQSACFMDSTDPAQRPRIEGALERLVLAHIPIEYRNSCGLRDESDQRFWAAIRDSVSCQGSENYQSYFGPFLEDKDKYLLAASKTDLRTDEDFATYCEIVSRIDLSGAVKEDGSIDAENLRAQGPLFGAIHALIQERRWEE